MFGKSNKISMIRYFFHFQITLNFPINRFYNFKQVEEYQNFELKSVKIIEGLKCHFGLFSAFSL